MRGALVIMLMAATAHADNGAHKEGQYGGVSPGETSPRDTAARPARAKRPPARGTLTWIGFAAKDGGAEVFFQSVAPFELSQRVEGDSLVVHLNLVRLGHNTWRQIDTRFFDNPLSGVAAKTVSAARASKGHAARAAGIEARIAFKAASDAKEAAVRTATEPDGMYYAYLTFPQGSAAAMPPGPPPTPARPTAQPDEPDADDASDAPGPPAKPDDEAPPPRNAQR
jgi:hypothetical protein